LVGCTGGTTVDAGAPGSSTAATVTTTATITTTTITTVAPTTTTTVPGVSAGLADAPAALAGELAQAEHTIRDPAADPAAVDAAGRVQQLDYRRINAHRDWIDAMRAALPDDVRVAFDLNVGARAPIPDAPAPPPPPATIPAWTIHDPKPVDDLMGFYHEAERATGVPWYYLAAINLAETAMGRIDGVSSAGAAGPMQFLPSTWASCCTGDISDDHDAIMGAAIYLARSGAPDRMDDAVLQYNPSRAYLQAVTNYAEVMRLDERAYRGYHAWQVFVATSVGPIRLPVGFTATEPIDAATYLAAHPSDRG
jgi:hypothetical protein